MCICVLYWCLGNCPLVQYPCLYFVYMTSFSTEMNGWCALITQYLICLFGMIFRHSHPNCRGECMLLVWDLIVSCISVALHGVSECMIFKHWKECIWPLEYLSYTLCFFLEKARSSYCSIFQVYWIFFAFL